MRIKYNDKNVISLIVILLSASIALGFLHISILYVLLMIEIMAVSLVFASRFHGKITLVQFLWIVSTAYIILTTRTFNFLVLYYLLNTALGLMVLISIKKETIFLVYYRFKCFWIFGLLSAITIFVEMIFPNTIINIYRAISPNEVEDIIIYLRRGRYLGITNYVWYTTLLLFLGGGYILSEYRTTEKKYRFAFALVIVALLIASFLTGSRSTMVLFPLIAVAFYGGRNTIINAFKALFVLALLYVIIMYSGLQLRIIDTFQNLINHFINGESLDSARASFRELAISFFHENSLLGIGWYEYRNRAFEVFGKYYHVHNLYLQLLAENGIVGTFVIVLPWLGTYVKTFACVYNFRKYKDLTVYRIAKYCLFIQTLFYIDSVIHVTLYDPRTMLIFYIICGISLQCSRVAPDSSYYDDYYLHAEKGRA